MKQINWGIIGSGSIASAFAHSIKSTSNSELIGLYGRNVDTTNAFAKKFNIDAHYQLNDLLSSPEIDAVYVATPHSEHFAHTFQAIKNHKHVLCEKPFTMNAYESMILIDLAKQSNIFLMEGFMYRTHPQTKNILDNLHIFSGDKEKILIESSFGFAAEVPIDHRLRNPNLGGGAILDIGCYPLTMCKLIAGHLQGLPFAEPREFSATGELDETGVDLQSNAHIIFSDSIEAKISCAVNENFSNDLLVSSGEKSIAVNQPWHCGQFQDGRSSILVSTPELGKQEISFIDEFGLFSREIEHASSCILQQKAESEFITHTETQSNMFWLDQWRERMKIECPKNSLKNSPISLSNTSQIRKPILKKITLPRINKIGSRLALGCDNQISDLHAFTMFDHFYESGGRIFDTAYIYNHGKGDKYLGDWINLRGVAKEVIVIGKAAHTPECEPKFIRPQILESLDRLNIPKIDIFCLHRDNRDVPVDEFVDVLSDIQKEGLIEIYGASNWELDRFSSARANAKKNKKEPFSALSNNFSLAEMMQPVWPGCVGVNEKFLEYIINEKILLFPWSSQARGFFIKKKEQISNVHFSNPTLDEEMRVWHYEKNLKRREKCFELAEKKNVEPIQIALAYVLHQSDLIFPLIGPRTLSETNSSIDATKIKLSVKELEELSQD